MRKRSWGAGIAALSLVVAACGGDDSGSDAESETTAAGAETTSGGAETTASGGTSGGECETVDDVRFQLQWAIQAQFAGYVAARDLGFYEDRCLNVELLEATVDIPPQQVLADGGADFAIAWVPKALQTREQGAEITQIAQMFQRSGTLQVSFKDAGITSVADFSGKNIGNWGFGNEYEIFAALTEAGLDPATDVTLVQQDFNMNGLLSGDIDAAEAMTYNEYAQVLEAENPETGELYQPDDLNVVSYEEVGVGMLQDAIWADSTRMEDPAYTDIATRLLAASIEGWVHCRDNPQECADLVVEAGSQLGASHQLWQMNEVNKLTWPSPEGIGMLDSAAWDRTVNIAETTANLEGTTVLTAPPTEGAYNMELIEAALALVSDLDTTGEDFEPIEVTLEPGGA
jgi:NitT/TauT family transport system substrate-binding protein